MVTKRELRQNWEKINSQLEEAKRVATTKQLLKKEKLGKEKMLTHIKTGMSVTR